MSTFSSLLIFFFSFDILSFKFVRQSTNYPRIICIFKQSYNINITRYVLSLLGFIILAQTIKQQHRNLICFRFEFKFHRVGQVLEFFNDMKLL